MSICGTPEYLAPEVIRKQGHSKTVDWWCLGCIIYEMVTGFPPFRNQNRMELFESIIYQPLHMPSHVSPTLQNLLTRLLEKNPKDRLGSMGPNEIKAHPWFEKVNWAALSAKAIKAPFVPILTSDSDTSNFDEAFTSCSVESYTENTEMVAEGKNFDGFSYGA